MEAAFNKHAQQKTGGKVAGDCGGMGRGSWGNGDFPVIKESHKFTPIFACFSELLQNPSVVSLSLECSGRSEVRS